MGNELWSNMPEDILAECVTGKYKDKPIPEDIRLQAQDELARRQALAEQAQEALVSQIAVETAREARKAMIAKITKALEKVWSDDLTNVLITREEVDDTEHGAEVEIVKTLGQPAVKEMRYPKVKALVVRTNIFWSEVKQGSPTKSGKSDATKRAIKVSKRSNIHPNELDLVGNFRSANEACGHLGIAVGKDSATRVLQRDGYFTEPYDGTDFTIAK